MRTARLSESETEPVIAAQPDGNRDRLMIGPVIQAGAMVKRQDTNSSPLPATGLWMPVPMRSSRSCPDPAVYGIKREA